MIEEEEECVFGYSDCGPPVMLDDSGEPWCQRCKDREMRTTEEVLERYGLLNMLTWPGRDENWPIRVASELRGLEDDLRSAQAEIESLKADQRWFDQWLTLDGADQIKNLAEVYETRKGEISDMRAAIERSCDETMSRLKHENRRLTA